MSVQKFYTMTSHNQPHTHTSINMNTYTTHQQQQQPQQQQQQQQQQHQKDNHFDDPNCYFYTNNLNTKHKLYDNLMKPSDHHNENHMSYGQNTMTIKNDQQNMIPITLNQLDCSDLTGGHTILHIQNQNIYTHQIHQPIQAPQQQQQPQQIQQQQQQQQQQPQRRDFYTDNRTQLIGTDQNILQNLDLTSTQPLTTNSCNFGDYVIKYESTGNHHAHDNVNELDDEDEEDEMDDDDDCDNSFIYDTSDAGSNIELKNTNASLLDGYSVFDSPLSLYTSNDEFNNALLNSLNTSTRDYSGLYSLGTNTQQHQKQTQQQASGSLSSNPHDVSASNSSSTTTSSSSNSQQSQQLNSKDEHTQLKNSKNEASLKNDNQSNIPILNDYELISLPLRELNKRLRFVPKSAAIDLKKRRRTLKNRKYAQNCRSKRLEQKSEMEIQNMKLKGELSRLQKILEKTTKEKYLYKAYITELVKDPSKINSLQLEWNDISKE